MDETPQWYSLDEMHSLQDLGGDFSWYLTERLKKLGLDQLKFKEINHEFCVHSPCDRSHLLKNKTQNLWYWYGCNDTSGSISNEWTTSYTRPSSNTMCEWNVVADALE